MIELSFEQASSCVFAYSRLRGSTSMKDPTGNARCLSCVGSASRVQGARVRVSSELGRTHRLCAPL
jgi:hypothetical protein